MKHTVLRPSDISDIVGWAIKKTGVQQCSLAGFSLGGKLVIKLVELAPGNINQVLLIAPDGLKVNPLYWLVTHTIIGRELFHFFISYPQPILLTSKFLSKSGLMNKKIDGYGGGNDMGRS